GLVIKDMGSKSFYRGQTAEKQVADLCERGYPIDYIDRSLSEPELVGLYAACDCLVQPFRGEGFALPVVEAMACGLPVIATGAGPMLDYASDETAYLIPVRRGNFAECRVGDLETIGRPWLWEPDVDALAELLKRVAADPASARGKGAAASAWIREHFTWAHAAEAVERRLFALIADENQPRIVTDDHEWGANKAAPEEHPPESSLVSADSYPCPSVSIRGPNPAGHQLIKVSLTMIVRDEEKNLSSCLESVRGLFDE